MHTLLSIILALLLPEIIADVQPAPGVVSLYGETPGSSEGAWPQGVQQVSLRFDCAMLEVNPDCSSPVQVRLDGKWLAATRNITVDPFLPNETQFMFDEPMTLPGLYKVSVPQGVWLADGVPTPEFTLEYTIRRSYEAIPAEGYLARLSFLYLKFPGELSYLDGEITLTNQYGTPQPIRTSLDDNVLQVQPDPPITEEGPYILEIDPSALMWETDEGVALNEKIRARYYVSPMPAPEISPAPGELKSVNFFHLNLPKGYTLTVLNEQIISGLYALDASGNPLPEPAWRFKTEMEGAQLRLYPVRADGSRIYGYIYPANGDYRLILGEGIYETVKDNVYLLNPPFEYDYRFMRDDAVESILQDDRELPVYDLQGRPAAGNSGAGISVTSKGKFIGSGR